MLNELVELSSVNVCVQVRQMGSKKERERENNQREIENGQSV